MLKSEQKVFDKYKIYEIFKIESICMYAKIYEITYIGTDSLINTGTA